MLESPEGLDGIELRAEIFVKDRFAAAQRRARRARP